MPIATESRIERKALWIMLAGSAVFLWPLALLFRQSFARGTEITAIVHLFGFELTRPASTEGWLLAFVVAGVFVSLSMRSYPLIRHRLFSWSTLKLVSIPFSVFAGIVEEVWFRRALMDGVQAWGYGALVQICVAALVFGALHAVWGIGARSAMVAIGAMVATGLLGAALAVVYIVAGRVVAPCIWSHAAINLVLEPWLLVAAMTRGMELRSFPTTN